MSLKPGGHSSDHVEGKVISERGICHLDACRIYITNFTAQGTVCQKVSSRWMQPQKKGTPKNTGE